MKLYETIANDFSQFKRDLIAILDFADAYDTDQLIDAVSSTFNEHESEIIDNLKNYFEIYDWRGNQTNIPSEIESALNDFEHTSIGPDAFDPESRDEYFDELRERIYNFFDNLQGN